MMKILVFDDNPVHCKAAAEQLKDHQLTIVSTYGEASSVLAKWRKPDFDVVMTDLLVPASESEQNSTGRKFVGQEMPLGTTIALKAIAAGIKRVVILTDMNHHNHPASAALDGLKGFQIGDVKLFCANSNVTIPYDEITFQPIDQEFIWSTEGESKYPKQEFPLPRKGTVEVKDWADALRRIEMEGFGYID